MKYSFHTTGTTSFDIAASFDGIETDTQMRYASNNDAHFVMNYNSMFNPNNQSGLNLVIGSDGLVYKIVPSVTSGAGLPASDNVDTSQTYTQPQPAYTSGNASGLTGNLEPYDRPGKIKHLPHLRLLPPAEAGELRTISGTRSSIRTGSTTAPTRTPRRCGRRRRCRTLDSLAAALPGYLCAALPAADLSGIRRGAADHARDGGASARGGVRVPVPEHRGAATSQPSIQPTTSRPTSYSRSPPPRG